jgi:hypothetical protein
MITVFNRKELITLVSMQKLFHVREALATAGIESHVKSSGAMAFTAGRKHGIPFVDQDSAYTYTSYVRKDDYSLAVAAIQTALRNG